METLVNCVGMISPLKKSSSAEESLWATPFVTQKTKSELDSNTRVSRWRWSSTGIEFLGSCENEMRGLIPRLGLSEHVFMVMDERNYKNTVWQVTLNPIWVGAKNLCRSVRSD